MPNGILWLASYPKSGNTWVRIFLHNLFRNATAPAPINEVSKATEGDANIAAYERIAGKPVFTLTHDQIHDLRRPLQREWANRRETTIVKTHNMLGEINGKPLIYLEYTAAAIYVVRNVFDVAVSFSHHFNTDIDDAVEGICQASMHTPTTKAAVVQVLNSWSEHYESWTSLKGFNPLVVRYEDMRKKPLKAFSKITKYMNLPANQDRLKRAIKFSSFEEVSSQEKQGGFTERVHQDQIFFRSGKVGGWRQHLSDAHVARLIDAHGETLLKLGYITRSGKPTV